MVTLPRDETIAISSVRGPGESRHALFLCGGRDKAPKRLAGIGIEPHDLATSVDAGDFSIDGVGGKARQSFLYASAERSRPYWTNVTHRIYTCWLSRF
jgi:hypothetical protein